MTLQTDMENAAYRLDDVVRAATGASPTPADLTGTDISLTLPAEAWRQLSITLLVAARSGLSEEDGLAVFARAVHDAAALQPDQR